MDVYFGDESYYKLERKEGLLYITLHTIYAGSPSEGVELKLILDTGAYMTVLSRGTAVKHGFDKLPKIVTSFTGFGGSVAVDFIRIPGLLILGRLHQDVPVLVPHDMYRIDEKTGEPRQMQEVLGLNVLEYYNYFISTENDRLYLQENSKPAILQTGTSKRASVFCECRFCRKSNRQVKRSCHSCRFDYSEQ